jgi:hypothetical protein
MAASETTSFLNGRGRRCSGSGYALEVNPGPFSGFPRATSDAELDVTPRARRPISQLIDDDVRRLETSPF